MFTAASERCQAAEKRKVCGGNNGNVPMPNANAKSIIYTYVCVCVCVMTIIRGREY